MAKVPKFTPYSRNINTAYNNSSGRYRQSLANKLMDVYADTKDLDKMLAANIASVQARKLERKMQDELWKKQNYASRIVDETKLQTIDMGGSADNDAIRNLVRDMQEKVYEVKKMGREHPEFQHEVPRVIAEQEAAIQRMMGVATNVSVALDGYDKAMKIPPGQAGAVSVMTPDASQRVMLGIRDGSTSFVTKNGKLFGIRPNENGQPDVVNLDELSADIEKGNNFFQTVPDLTESLKGSYNNVFKPGGKDNADLITFEEKRVGSQVATVKFMTPEQREQGIKSLVNGNQFKGILDDESRMKVIWSDMMGKDVPWQQVEGDTREEVEANLAKQRNEAAYFLAQKAVEDNAAPDGIKMVEGRSKYQPKGSGTQSQKPEKVARDMRAQKARIDSMEYLGKDPNEIAKYLTDLNRGDSFYEVVDDAYIDGLVDEEKESEYIEKNAKSDSEEDLQKAKEEYRTKFLKNYKKGDIVDKNGNVIDVSTQKALERAILDEEGFSKDEQLVYRANASVKSKKAYESLEEDKRPSETEKYFEVDGQRYLNPVYLPKSQRTYDKGVNSENESKSFKKNKEKPTDNKPVTTPDPTEQPVAQASSTSFRTTMNQDTQKRVDRFGLDGSTGQGKANILKDGKKITGKKDGITIEGVRASGQDLVVDASFMGIGKKGDLGKFTQSGNGVKFKPGNDYDRLTGEDKKDFDAFIKAMESDPAFAAKVQESIKGNSKFNSSDYT